jgi:hypothetical protein
MMVSMEGGHGHEKKHDSHESHGSAHNEWIGNALKAISIGYAVIALGPLILPTIIATLPQYLTMNSVGIAAGAFFLGRKSSTAEKSGGHGGHGAGHGGH